MKANKKWYSILIAVLVTGFMLMLTTSILSLVISESKDTQWYSEYLRWYYWAEWWIEMGLLAYSDNSFNVYKVDETLEDELREMISEEQPVHYDVQAFNTEITDTTLRPWEYHKIPLYTVDKFWNVDKVNDIVSFEPWIWWNNVAWNIVSENWGIYSKWQITNWNSTKWTEKIINTEWIVEYKETEVNTFLNQNDRNVMIIFNNSGSDTTYNLKSASYRFKLWEWNIISSSKRKWSKYKQNLRLHIDTREWENFLKYSIYDPIN